MILNYLNAMRETSNARLTRLFELAIGSLTPPAGKRRIIVAVSYGFICHFIFLLGVLSMVTAIFFWNEQEFRWRSTALDPCGEPSLDFTISSGTLNFTDQAWLDPFSQAGTIWPWSEIGHNHVCDNCLDPIIGIICSLDAKWNYLVTGTRLACVTLVNAVKMRPKNQLLNTLKKFQPS
ncbi:MAG: hypothetical protein ISQ30_10390 [Rhodobacteraceae bacterium]|nr:hypothetical protein [Paracoccaceae bacterium]MBL6789850.1 hypothetical protein [Paracoccaceae bacterium]